MNMIDIADDLAADRTLAPAYLKTGLLGSEDFLYYIPLDAGHLHHGRQHRSLALLARWRRHQRAHLGTIRPMVPKHPERNRRTEMRPAASWSVPPFPGRICVAFFHRRHGLQFPSTAAMDMLVWARDTLWPTIHPESINYEFMQEPLMAGEVWVAFDHTARLLDAFNAQPDQFIAFPAPAGPAGRGFMPVVVGLGIPAAAPNPEAGAAIIEFLTRPDVQGAVLRDLGFFPVVDGVDTSDLPAGVDIEAGAVAAQANSPDALPALLPVGLGDRGGEINQIYRNAFDRVVLNGEDVQAVLAEEGGNLQALMNETGAPCWAPMRSDGPCQVTPLGEAPEASMAPTGTSTAVFFSTQFVPIEEQEKFRAILQQGG
ncbi:ABC transporter substrate-binding protein [Candidatus Amarobacter glycogenicus]|uniref:ABC transporter substrate-binding protein n=1 Tax=Candidatus Amarobacter glycogenicus TaxID=3140699 RepID=UPI002A0F8F7A|nr:extracellular solute-binding protein [Dehalococcoidia bacterium]